MRGTTRVRAAVCAAGLLLTGAVGGCSQGKDEGPEPSASVTTLDPGAPAAAPLVVKQGSLQGFLTGSERERVVQDVAAVVDTWIEDAWVAGEWPRTVSGVWGTFTRDAAASAAADADLTSGAGYGERVSAVHVARRDVTVDLLAQQGTPHGATARVALTLDVTPLETPETTAKVAVRARLFLTPTDKGWKIFGHDVTRGGF